MYLINIVFSSLILVIIGISVAGCLLNLKLKFNIKNIVLIIIVAPAIITISFFLFENIIRIIVNCISISILIKIVYKEKYIRGLLTGTFIFIYFLLAELIFSLGIFFFIKEIDKNLAGTILINIEISFLVLLLVEIKKLRLFFKKIITSYNRINSYILLIISIVIIAVFANRNFLFSEISYEYILNLILLIVFGFFIYLFLKEKEYSSQLLIKYDQLFNYIKKYEKAINNKNMIIHDFKNQIIAIKGFAGNKNAEITDYINSIIKDFSNYEEKVLTDMEKLPKGGLKGLIYYKLGDLSKDKIDVLINVGSRIPKNLFKNLKSNLYKDLITIIGVYLDNAIEAVKTADKKQIILEIYYKKHTLHFILTNTYNNKLNLERLDDLGYSTKSKGRGYGLGLAKKIISSYQMITQNREITLEYYSVHLFVNLKKHSS